MRARRRGVLSRLSGWLGTALLALLAAAALFAAGRILLYRQSDDPERLASKREYLARVGERAAGAPPAPNLVVVLFDDLGAGDLGAYGSRSIHTPAIDRLAAEGALLTAAYSASPYCSGSRAGLLTGRYALRSGLDHVVQAPWTAKDLLLRLGWRNRRLPAEEITLAEVLQAAGYRTAVFGKWHLGDESPSLPNDLGFDSFFGLLHSNDQGRPVVRENQAVLERHPVDQSTLTRRYTERALEFLAARGDEPFLLYLPHTFPHVPLHVAAERRGESEAGLYGDVVEELDESVGEVAAALRRLGLASRTLVVVTSDNGPWFQGSAGDSRGRKMDVFEGGMKVPFIAWWPGRIPPGQVIDAPIMGIDLFPTALEMAGIEPPADRILDGRSLLPLLTRGGPPPHERLLFFQLGVLRAVREGRFKLHDRHRVSFGNPMDWAWGPFRRQGPWLFDLALDPSESYDVSDRHPEVARRLRQRLGEERRRFEANPRGWSDLSE